MRTDRLLITAVLSAGLVGMAGPAFASSDLDCANFEYQEDAQAVLEQDPSDPNRLDEGGEEGVACESLPRRGSSSTDDGDDGDATATATDDGAATGSDGDGSASDDDGSASDDDEMVMPAGGVDTGAGGTAGDVSGVLATGGLLAAAGAAGVVLLRRRPVS